MSDVEVMKGPRVTLRAPTLDDADLLFERMASDPEVSRYMSWRPLPNISVEPQDCLLFGKALR